MYASPKQQQTVTVVYVPLTAISPAWKKRSELTSRPGARIAVSCNVFEPGPGYKLDTSVFAICRDEQSEPRESRYVFSYTITIQNEGHVPARLLTRHWLITDANGKVQEVRGDGVVGEQPYLKPGQGFRYSSGAVIETPVGAMQGSYQMLSDDGQRFDA